MNNLTMNDRKIRDSIIIQLDVEEGLRTGKPSVEIVKQLAAKKNDLQHSQVSYEIDAPLILLEGEREDNSISEFYLDPSINFKMIPREIYFPKWTGFIRLMSSSKTIEGQTQQGYAYSLLQRAVNDCRINYGISTARTLVQRLHDNRWSIGPEMSAHLFTTATVNDEDEFKKIANDKTFINEYITRVRNNLNTIKQESRTLTEWEEGLYSINPNVWELLEYLRYSKLEDAEMWYRFFAEVDADIAPSSLMSTFSAMRQHNNDANNLGWLALFIRKRENSSSFSDFKKQLQYLLNARTSIPKYWMEIALTHYKTVVEALPKELDKVDPWRAVSIDILRSWSIKWDSNKHGQS